MEIIYENNHLESDVNQNPVKQEQSIKYITFNLLSIL